MHDSIRHVSDFIVEQDLGAGAADELAAIASGLFSIARAAATE